MKAIEDLLQEREARIRELEFSVKCLSDAELRAAALQAALVLAGERITKAKAILEDIGTVDAQRVLAVLEGRANVVRTRKRSGRS